jgi:hypothetical protein
MANADAPCCRCDGSSAVDQYEAREPHLLEDGFAVPRWHSPEHRRPIGDISYDLLMEDDMAFTEGSYRIGGCDWCVVIISKRPIDEPSWKPCTWDSGVSGIVVLTPACTAAWPAAATPIFFPGRTSMPASSAARRPRRHRLRSQTYFGVSVLRALRTLA